MKESDIRQKFDAATAAYARRLEEGNATTFLTALRDAVTALQEGGMDVSLEIRPLREGARIDIAKAVVPVANATTVANGQQLEWAVLSSYSDSALVAMIDNAEIAEFKSEREKKWSGPWQSPPTPGAVSLSEAVANVIINTAAQRQLLASYSVPANGVTGIIDKKPLAPPRLKATP